MEQTETTRVLLSLVHALFCKKHHPEDCNFYFQIELADCWELPDVVCWMQLTGLIMARMKLNEKGLLESLARVHRCLEGLSYLSESERSLFKAVMMNADLTVLLVDSAHVCETITLTEAD